MTSVAGKGALPTWLNQYAKYGRNGLIVGAILCLVALFTNPIPDPSFPWANLPASLRLPVLQPRIEHWPVTYTVGLWLWVISFPALFLLGYKHYAQKSRIGNELWLILLPVLAMLAWTTYCRFFWPKLYPPTWNAPAYTLVCWLYCATYYPVWSNLAYLISIIGIGAGLLAIRRSPKATVALATFGVLSFPLGIPVLYEAYRRYADKRR